MEREKNKNTAVMLYSVLYAQLFAFGVGLLLLLLFCAIAFSLDDPDTVIVLLSLTALYSGGIAGGVAAVRISGDGIFSGWLSGTLTTVLAWMLSLLPFPTMPGEFSPLTMTLFFICIPFSSVIGAVIGKRRKKKSVPAQIRRHKKHV